MAELARCTSRRNHQEALLHRSSQAGPEPWLAVPIKNHLVTFDQVYLKM